MEKEKTCKLSLVPLHSLQEKFIAIVLKHDRDSEERIFGKPITLDTPHD